MGKRNNSKLTVEKSLKIANNFIEVFKAFNSDVPCYLMSYPTENAKVDKELEEAEAYVTLIWSDRCPGKLKSHKYKTTSEDDWYKNNTYELYYKGHKYMMNLYESPEVCGYYVGEEYDSERHIFCIIRLVNIHDLTVKDLAFTFDVESMKFLELYWITRIIHGVFLDEETGELHWEPKIIKEPKSYISLEKKLRGRSLGKVQK